MATTSRTARNARARADLDAAEAAWLGDPRNAELVEAIDAAVGAGDLELLGALQVAARLAPGARAALPVPGPPQAGERPVTAPFREVVAAVVDVPLPEEVPEPASAVPGRKLIGAFARRARG